MKRSLVFRQDTVSGRIWSISLTQTGIFPGRNFKGNFMRYTASMMETKERLALRLFWESHRDKRWCSYSLFGDKRPYLNKEICAGIISAETCPTVFEPEVMNRNTFQLRITSLSDSRQYRLKRLQRPSDASFVQERR